MAHALNNASHTSACAELGISVGTNRTQTSLTRHASINKWSFYRPGSIAPDGSDFITLTAPSNNDKLGDFRGYAHSAITPTTPADYDKNWGPGGTTIEVTFNVYTEQWNLWETTGGSTPYISVRYYESSANRASQTSYFRTYTVVVTSTSNSPPTGHTNNQTLKQASASQLVTDSNFPASYVDSGDTTIYVDIYISDISGNQVARFGSVLADGHVDIDFHENAYPYVDGCWGNWTPVPPDYGGNSWTFIAVVVTNSSSAKDAVDFQESNGSSTYGTFYWYVYGLNAGTYYRIGNCDVTAQLQGDIPTTTIFNSTLNSASSTSNQSASGSLSSGTWAWDDIADVVLTAVDWTGYDVYSLGSTAPTCT